MPRIGHSFIKRLAPYWIPAIALSLVVLLWKAAPSAVESVHLKVFDTYQHLKPRTYRDAPVRVVDLDEESLTMLGQWPWPRTQLARLVTQLTQLGASAIAFDIVFSEPDRTSPAEWARLLEGRSEFDLLREKINAMPGHDRIFAEAISKSPVVTGMSFIYEDNKVVPESKASFAYPETLRMAYVPSFPGAVRNLPVLEAGAAGSGSFTIFAERDGIFRRAPMLFRRSEALYPSLAAEAVRVKEGAAGYVIKSSGDHGIAGMKTGRYVMPTDDRGRLWLYDSGYAQARWIPAWRVLAGKVSPDEIDGKIVFIGSSAVGLKDIRATPLNPVAAGLEVQAQLTEQILLGEFLYRPAWAPAVELFFLFLLGLLFVFCMPRLGALWGAVLAWAAIAAAVGGSWYAFAERQMLFDPVLPSIASAVPYLIASLVNFFKTESEKQHIRNAFSHYMSPAVVAELARDPSRLRLGGETRYITVLFADIRGFTAISEQMEPVDLTALLNRYLTPMTEIILAHNGTIDKYMGDCIMAFWNAPLDNENHARDACRAAAEIRSQLSHWNKEVRAEAEANGRLFIPIEIGIGINTGNCYVGNMGSTERFNYSVLGDNVNFASRLEGQTKLFGVDIVVGENTFREANEVCAVELDLVRVKGKKVPEHIFALLKSEGFENDESMANLRTRHKEMLACYRNQDWPGALKCLEECRTLDRPGRQLKTLYDLYTYRIKLFMTNSPGPGWEGVTTALTK